MNSLGEDSLPPPDPTLQASVIVPAKDEAQLLPRLLSALARQTDVHGRRLSTGYFEVILLINNSHDDSLGVAQRFARANPDLCLHVLDCHLASGESCIGWIRRELMNLACERLLRSRAFTTAILSTDADSEPAPDWVSQNLLEIASGADAVGGLIELDPCERAQLAPAIAAMQKLDDQYRTLLCWLEDHVDGEAHDPWPRHYHHFCGSFAIRPEVYHAVGGLPQTRALEDIALFEVLLRHDKRFRHSTRVRMRTSARVNGRAEDGLAQQLSRWARKADLQNLVDSPAFSLELFKRRRVWRGAWLAMRNDGTEALQSIAQAENIFDGSRTAFLGALRAETFGRSFELAGIEEQLRKISLQEPLERAVEKLQAWFDNARRLSSCLSEAHQADSFLLAHA